MKSSLINRIALSKKKKKKKKKIKYSKVTYVFLYIISYLPHIQEKLENSENWGETHMSFHKSGFSQRSYFTLQ